MNLTPSGSLALQYIKLSDVLEIHDGIIFDSYLGLPHIRKYTYVIKEERCVLFRCMVYEL